MVDFKCSSPLKNNDSNSASIQIPRHSFRPLPTRFAHRGSFPSLFLLKSSQAHFGSP